MSLLLPLERWLINLEEDVDPGYLFIYVARATALVGLLVPRFRVDAARVSPFNIGWRLSPCVPKRQPRGVGRGDSAP